MTQPWHGSLRGTLPTLALLIAAILLAPSAHASTGSLTDTTVADFNSGGPNTDTYVAETDDGEVMLTPTDGVEFYGSAMPAGWSSTPLESEGAAIVQDGALQADGARVSADLAHEPGRSLEFVATFGAEQSQSAGLGDFSAPGGAQWAMFSTLGTSTDLYVRTNVGIGSIDTLIPGSFLGAPHRFGIDWNLASVDFYIDGAWVATHPVSPAASMPPFAADELVGGESIALDWLRISPYPGSGSFLSRVLDAGRQVDWEALSWTNESPAGTAVSFSARTGDTPTPDGTWTSFAPVALSGDPVGGTSRYVQYRVDLTSSDPARTPVLDDGEHRLYGRDVAHGCDRRRLRHAARPLGHGHRRHLARGRGRHLQRACGRRKLHDRRPRWRPPITPARRPSTSRP